MSEKNVLFIAPTRIGDAILAASLLRHIYDTTPDTHVTIATSPLAAPLFAGYPNLVRIIPITKRSYNRHWLAVWRAVAGTRWHAVWDVRGSVVSFLIRAQSRHVYRSPKTNEPKVKQYERALGTAPLPYPVLWPTDADIKAAQALMPDGEKYLVFAPIANWEPKEWPLDHFIALATLLLDGLFSGHRPVIVCAGHEREKARPMLEALARFSPIDLTKGESPLLTVFACMQRAHGFIGNDSGLMHMAAAANIPTLGLFGPTPADVYQPWGMRAQAMRAPDGVLSKLTPQAVAERFAAIATA